MNELKNLHNALLIIADEIDRLCRENNIQYTLYAGTLIGAIRHKGFIPWDDDFDIAMLRNDYIRFIEVCMRELKPEFGMVNIDNTDNYGYGFMKITLKGTKVLQGGYSKPKDYVELWVDIFPIDNIPQNKILRTFHKTVNYISIKILEERYDGIHINNKKISKIIAFKIFFIINMIISPKVIKNVLIKNSLKYDKNSSNYVSSLASPYGYDREILSCEFFANYIDIDFEKRKYKIIAEYDKWLTNVYGDYMELPPIEKRHTHSFIDVNLGIYQ